MLRNYFLTAFRSFLRNKSFALINITGLAIGISASLVIFLIVSYDFSFDRFHPDGNRIYRVVSNFTFNGNTSWSSGVPSPMGSAVARELTGIENTSAFRTWNMETKISIPVSGSLKPVVFKNQINKIFADKHYFQIFKYVWLIGSPETSLNEPNTVVLTESKAKIYFPGAEMESIAGREIIFNDTIRTTITGIVKDISEHTDFTFKIFVSLATLEKTSLKPGDWNEWNNVNSASQLFVMLPPGKDPTQVAAAITNLFEKHVEHDPEDHSRTAYELQPLRDIHFNNHYDNFDQRLAHKPTLYGLLAIAAFLLLLGCINFINLTTANSAQRSKEIGIRKTVGGVRRQLVMQFMCETFLLTVIATVLSVVITPLLLKAFSDFIPEGLHFHLLQPGILIYLLGITVTISFLSGIYPALVLSSCLPVSVLKSRSNRPDGMKDRVWLRKVLSVSQFAVAQIFIIATLLVSKQIRYSINKDLGYRRDAVVYFSTGYYDADQTKRMVLLEKLKAIPEIQLISLGFSNPTSSSGWTSTIKYNDGKKESELTVQVTLGDTNYIKLYQLRLLAGENLPFSDTVNSVLINETYSKALGYSDPQMAVGRMLDWNRKKTPVVGVLADFHQHSLHEPISPLLVANSWKSLRTFNIAFQPQNAEGTVWKTAIAKIDKAWKEIYPEEELALEFVDEKIAAYYESEMHISKLLMWATGLAIFISCLGLLGLVIYITNTRMKEIGIRKVIGASVAQIISLLSKDFLKVIILAFIISVPVAWYGVNRWLESFAYRTSLSWWVFVSGGCIMFLVALIVLVSKTFIAASANPVNHLRSE
jgi:putative ABC transport system permease protein